MTNNFWSLKLVVNKIFSYDTSEHTDVVVPVCSQFLIFIKIWVKINKEYIINF